MFLILTFVLLLMALFATKGLFINPEKFISAREDFIKQSDQTSTNVVVLAFLIGLILITPLMLLYLGHAITFLLVKGLFAKSVALTATIAFFVNVAILFKRLLTLSTLTANIEEFAKAYIPLPGFLSKLWGIFYVSILTTLYVTIIYLILH
jgi:hypothetical protein